MDHIAAIYIEVIQPMTFNVSLMYKVNLISFINHYLHQILKLIVDRSYFTDLSYSVTVGYHASGLIDTIINLTRTLVNIHNNLHIHLDSYHYSIYLSASF